MNRIDLTVKGAILVKGHPDNIQLFVDEIQNFGLELLYVKISTNTLTVIEKTGGGR